MQQEIIFTPADFVAVLNQTLEFAYPKVVIEGELASFRIARDKWLYFDLKDDLASVSFFGNVMQLPGPLEDGMMLRVVGLPRLHQRFGFSVNVASISLVGEGSIKKAADLLKQKLLTEGLFSDERKQPLPAYPTKIGLITAVNSAAYSDFIKISGERWGGLEITVADAVVQGDRAPVSITSAIEHINTRESVEVLVITRGGGSAEDLAAFNDERVVRAIAASRIPTIVAIGHENDLSLAELAADARASTPTNAAMLAVPDAKLELAHLKSAGAAIAQATEVACKTEIANLSADAKDLSSILQNSLNYQADRLASAARLAASLDPVAPLRRGYALIRQDKKVIRSIKGLAVGEKLSLSLADGTIDSVIKGLSKNA